MQWFEALYGPGLQPELAGMKPLFDTESPEPRKNEVLLEQKWLVDGVGFQRAREGQFFVKSDDARVIVGAAGAGMVAGHLSARLDGTLQSEDFMTDGKPVKIWVKGQGATVSLVIRNYELVGHGPTTAPLRQSVSTNQWRLYQFPTDLWKGEPDLVACFWKGNRGDGQRLWEDGRAAQSSGVAGLFGGRLCEGKVVNKDNDSQDGSLEYFPYVLDSVS